MKEKTVDSVAEVTHNIKRLSDRSYLAFLGAFVIGSAIQLTLSDKNNDLVFMTFEYDANSNTEYSLRDISGKFEEGTNYEKGLINIDLNEDVQNIYTIAVIILEVLKLREDPAILLQLLMEPYNVKVRDMRK